MGVLANRPLDVTRQNRLECNLYIPEADFELLIRTLSEARSRATELAASISARLGPEHRLAELANGAASRVEKMLRDIRAFAAAGADTSAGLVDLQDALQSESQTVTLPPMNPPEPAPQQMHSGPTFAIQTGLEPEHWLPMFVQDLIAQLRASGGITFEVAERLLQQRKDDFLRDFLVARRMYRTYPRLFPELHSEVEPHEGPRLS